MTSVVLNKVGMDLVDIEVEQTGTAFTDIFFQDPVLDYTKEYVLGVSELTVPLGDEPMFTEVPSTEVFMRVRRKGYYAADGMGGQAWFPIRYGYSRHPAGAAYVVGEHNGPGTQSANTPFNVIPESWAKFYCHRNGLNIQTPAQFYDELKKWVAGVNHNMDAKFATEHGDVNLGNNIGGLAICDLKVFISPSGRISFRASGDFWAQCYLECTPFGKLIMGAPSHILHYGPDDAQGRPQTSTAEGVFTDLTRFDTITGAPLVDIAADQDASLFIEPTYGDNAPRSFTFDYSALRYMEGRLRIEVDADLSIPANILVENGKQKMHYNIASFALPNEYKSEIVMNQADDQIQEEVSLITESHVGDTLIKRKTTPVSDWYKLQDSSNLQNMRLHIFVVRRDWNQGENKFTLVRNKLRMSEATSWKLTLKFVQLF